MAKSSNTLVRMVSSAGTGVFYLKAKNARKTTKMKLKKYDRKARKHVVFEEKKDS